MRLSAASTADNTRAGQAGRWKTLLDKPRLELDKPALVVRNNSLAMRVASRTSVDRKGELPTRSELMTVHRGVAFPWNREHGRLCHDAERSAARVIMDNNA